MKVFNCILGVASILGAVYCIFFPGMSFLHAGWIMTLIMGGWGVCAIFDFAQNKKKQNKSGSEIAMGVISLIMGISAAVVSVVGIFVPAVRLMVDVTILWMLIGWFLCIGVNSIFASIGAKKMGAKGWVFTLVMGILTILGSLYGMFHLVVFAQAMGLGIGALLMVYGVRLFCSLGEND